MFRTYHKVQGSKEMNKTMKWKVTKKQNILPFTSIQQQKYEGLEKDNKQRVSQLSMFLLKMKENQKNKLLKEHEKSQVDKERVISTPYLNHRRRESMKSNIQNNKRKKQQFIRISKQKELIPQRKTKKISISALSKRLQQDQIMGYETKHLKDNFMRTVSFSLSKDRKFRVSKLKKQIMSRKQEIEVRPWSGRKQFHYQ